MLISPLLLILILSILLLPLFFQFHASPSFTGNSSLRLRSLSDCLQISWIAYFLVTLCLFPVIVVQGCYRIVDMWTTAEGLRREIRYEKLRKEGVEGVFVKREVGSKRK